MLYQEAHPEFNVPFVHYGLGWMVEEPGGIQMLGHYGGVKGFQAAFLFTERWFVHLHLVQPWEWCR